MSRKRPIVPPKRRSVPRIAGIGPYATRKELMRVLHREANSLRGLYGAPVYLCGSALMDNNAKPRDWDFRITLTDADFALRYGDTAAWEDEGHTGKWTDVRWRWSDDCVKQSKIAASRTGLNVDLQVYPASHARQYKGRPRIRLDTRRS